MLGGPIMLGVWGLGSCSMRDMSLILCLLCLQVPDFGGVWSKVFNPRHACSYNSCLCLRVFVFVILPAACLVCMSKVRTLLKMFCSGDAILFHNDWHLRQDNKKHTSGS